MSQLCILMIILWLNAMVCTRMKLLCTTRGDPKVSRLSLYFLEICMQHLDISHVLTYSYAVCMCMHVLKIENSSYPSNGCYSNTWLSTLEQLFLFCVFA